MIGAIVVSKLGLNQFDDDDLRLLEVLAGHAAVALENASLYEAQRREAESAKALLEFGRELAAAEGLDDVLERVVHGTALLFGAPHASLWLQEPGSGDLVGLAAAGYEEDVVGRRFPAATIAPFVQWLEPFVLGVRDRTFSDLPLRDVGPYFAAPFTLDGRWGLITVAPARTATPATASSTCSAASRTRRSSRSRTPRASKGSSARSSPRSRRSRTRSRRATSTPPHTLAGSPTRRFGSAAGSGSTASR